LREAVAATRHTLPFEIGAFVVLPNHLHAVLRLPPDDSDFSTRWRLIKSRFAKTLPKKSDAALFASRATNVASGWTPGREALRQSGEGDRNSLRDQALPARVRQRRHGAISRARLSGLTAEPRCRISPKGRAGAVFHRQQVPIKADFAVLPPSNRIARARASATK